MTAGRGTRPLGGINSELFRLPAGAVRYRIRRRVVLRQVKSGGGGPGEAGISQPNGHVSPAVRFANSAELFGARDSHSEQQGTDIEGLIANSPRRGSGAHGRTEVGAICAYRRALECLLGQ